MSRHSREGFTLVELMIGLVLVGLLGAGVYRILLDTQRTSRTQVAQSSRQADARSGILVLPDELRELGYSQQPGSAVIDSDLLEMADDRVVFRAMRGFSITCGTPTTEEVRVLSPWQGYRSPAAADSFLLFVEKAETVAEDDRWVKFGVQSVDLNSTCGADPAIRLTLNALTPLDPIDISDLRINGPVRSFEVMEMGLYEEDGAQWLGLRSLSAGDAGYRPVLGPLAAADGLRFRYFNAANGVVATTGNPDDVRSIEVTVRVPGGDGDGPAQALTTRVALRNALRP